MFRHFGLIALLLLSSLRSEACTPCEKLPSPYDAYQIADLIVVGRSLNLPRKNDRQTPTHLKIKTILKKDEKIKSIPQTLDVPAYYDDCRFGLLLPPEQDYMIFLKKAENSWETFECKARELEINKGKVRLNGKILTPQNWILEWKNLLENEHSRRERENELIDPKNASRQ